jgi:hypothetical protein
MIPFNQVICLIGSVTSKVVENRETETKIRAVLSEIKLFHMLMLIRSFSLCTYVSGY